MLRLNPVIAIAHQQQNQLTFGDNSNSLSTTSNKTSVVDAALSDEIMTNGLVTNLIGGLTLIKGFNPDTLSDSDE
ncbi:uncharacterized protein ASCRUDRAFT_5942 [Ascoidea rubescens DSM 1968]|uniref:Uncharacterized protein n=1 Tax=Ascoidea rubescens DSM 1968 TaxID=1344418 RepID=A0A1D2VR26_9ASCO|nr:hypothetical protein ASCRUDRAFT_5942 [Ascoidea rubescens DSM 1968]ODV64062.1 hypothetical protein ASCRUDRAFT_5942 [Ascoidea rubescens DSM 1968]